MELRKNEIDRGREVRDGLNEKLDRQRESSEMR